MTQTKILKSEADGGLPNYRQESKPGAISNDVCTQFCIDPADQPIALPYPDESAGKQSTRLFDGSLVIGAVDIARQNGLLCRCVKSIFAIAEHCAQIGATAASSMASDIEWFVEHAVKNLVTFETSAPRN